MRLYILSSVTSYCKERNSVTSLCINVYFFLWSCLCLAHIFGWRWCNVCPRISSSFRNIWILWLNSLCTNFLLFQSFTKLICTWILLLLLRSQLLFFHDGTLLDMLVGAQCIWLFSSLWDPSLWVVIRNVFVVYHINAIVLRISSGMRTFPSQLAVIRSIACVFNSGR